MNTIVVGIGNPMRGDDAVGLEVAERLRSGGCAAVVVTWQGPDVNLIEVVRGFDQVVVVDAMHSGAPPGTIRRFIPGVATLPDTSGLGSTHALGVATVVRLAELLGATATWEFYGIEAGDVALGGPLSPAVAAAAGTLVEQLRARLATSESGSVTDPPPAADAGTAGAQPPTLTSGSLRPTGTASSPSTARKPSATSGPRAASPAETPPATSSSTPMAVLDTAT